MSQSLHLQLASHGHCQEAPATLSTTTTSSSSVSSPNDCYDYNHCGMVAGGDEAEDCNKGEGSASAE